jgi:hypothetical protein
MQPKIEHSRGQGWYVARLDGSLPYYLRKDGRWYPTCLDDGFYKTKEQAEQQLAATRQEQTDE